MKNFLTFISILLLSCSSLSGQDLPDPSSETVLIFVRHAEKADDGTHDPPLNASGQERAKNLAMLLTRDFDIDKVYSTSYKRTLETAAPLVNELAITTQIYGLDDPAALMKSMMRDHAGSQILITGHSNTTPMLVNQALGARKYGQLPEDEYSAIFIVRVHSNGTIIDEKLSY